MQAAAVAGCVQAAGAPRVGVEQPVGVAVEPVADTPPGHRIELPIQMHHAVIAVPDPYRPPSPQPAVLRLAAVGLTLSGPPLGLLGELLGPQRLRLGQKIAIGLDLSDAGLVERVGEMLGVGERHPTILNSLPHRRHRTDRLGGPHLAAGVVTRHPGALSEHMSPTVAMVAAAGHARRGQSLHTVELAAHRPGPRQHLQHLLRGDHAPLQILQQLRGRLIKPLNQFDRHRPSIAHPYDICQAFPGYANICPVSSAESRHGPEERSTTSNRRPPDARCRSPSPDRCRGSPA